jgi:protein tyrosine/serine phosphatase
LWLRGGILFLLTLSACAVQAAAPRNPNWAEPIALEYSDNFFRVAPCLYRSAQPDAKGMKAYEAMNIRTIINLRANHSDEDEAKGTSLILRHIPINTWNIQDEQVVAVLSLFRTEEPPILLHCQHGADRTGLMMAMYRIVEQGWTKEAALDELKQGGYGFHSVWRNIPDYIKKVDIERIRALVNERTSGAAPRTCSE